VPLLISIHLDSKVGEHTLLSGTESGRVVLAEVVVVVAVGVEHCCLFVGLVVVVID
jgi:hypothetical protein